MGKRKRRHGHFCWCCQQMLPNESFSGRGHGRHLCRACAKLGADELTFRQVQRDIDRLLVDGWRIGRRDRRRFEQFLTHTSERVRRYAAEIAERDARERAEFRAMLLADEEAFEASLEHGEPAGDVDEH